VAPVVQTTSTVRVSTLGVPRGASRVCMGGIVFDIDARKTSQTGVAQLPPGGAYPTDPEKPPAD
jgi:hypothetical protein